MLRPLFALVCLALLAADVTVPAPPAGAQEESDPVASVRLVDQPPWHRPDDRLNVRLQVENTGTDVLDGFVVRLGIHPRSASRSDLHESFDGFASVSDIGAFIEEFPQITLPPGASDTVTIDERLTTAFVSLAGVGEGGPYPLTVSLFDTSFTALDSFTTPLLYYPNDPETPLGFVLALPLSAVPARGPDGIFEADEGDEVPLEHAVAAGGWLTGAIDAIEEARSKGLKVGVAPTPRLVEELADMADGYTRAHGDDLQPVEASSDRAQAADTSLARLADVLDEREVQRILSPYSFADLDALRDRFPAELNPDQLLAQLTEGEQVLERSLSLDFTRRWIFAPAGRLDAGTIDDLRRLPAASATFFSELSLEQPDPSEAGCPGSSPSFSCSVVVETLEGTTRGYETDAALRERFAALVAPGNDRLDLQRLLAETSMIHAELPGTEDRVVQATAPGMWHPRPRLVHRLLATLARAPWLTMLTPEEGLERAVAATRQPVDELPPVARAPDDSYYAAVEEAAATIDNFVSISPPTELIERLKRNILVAQSRTWWSDFALLLEGRRFATESQAKATADLMNIGIESTVDEITLTSRRAPIQLQVSNGNDYPVTLQIDLSSQKLDFERQEVQQTFQPQTTTITVEVTAQSSGIFPLDVILETPEGEPIEPNGSKSIKVRSTEFNLVALAITLGALAFLVLFYLSRALRKRKHDPGDEPAEAIAS